MSDFDLARNAAHSGCDHAATFWWPPPAIQRRALYKASVAVLPKKAARLPWIRASQKPPFGAGVAVTTSPPMIVITGDMFMALLLCVSARLADVVIVL